MLRRTVTAAILATLLICGGVFRSARADESRPTVVHVGLTAERGFVSGSVASTGLFSERVIGTVQSGLPAVVDLLYYFSARSGGVLAEDVLSFSLAYDVWEDTYAIKAEDTTLSFPTFAGMRQAIEHLQHLKLIPLAALNPRRSYRVHMSIMINPLRGIDRDKMTEWVSEHVRTSADESWREQLLNLNDLISHFFSRERGAVNRSKWYQSEFFKPDSLASPDPEEE
jgi:hypothetical protein